MRSKKFKSAGSEFPPAPSHLSAESAAWFDAVVREFVMEEHHLRLLTMACESWDRSRQARAALDQHGLTYIDGHGNVKPRPEIQIEQASRISFSKLVKELKLDADPRALPQTVRPAATPLKYAEKIG